MVAAINLDTEIEALLVRQHEADQPVRNCVERDRLALVLDRDAQFERIDELTRRGGEVRGAVPVIEQAHIATLMTGVLEVEDRIGRLQRVHDVRRRRTRVLRGPLEMRIDVGAIVGDGASAFAPQAVDQVSEGAELEMLVARTIEITMIEQEL